MPPALVLFVALQAAPPAQPPRILLDPVDCLVADAFPQIEARIEPDDQVSRARVRFRREGDAHGYRVLMYRREGAWSAVLPKPKSGPRPVRYAIEVEDREAGSSSSREFVVPVADSPAACPGERVAAVAVSPPLVDVEVPDGTRSLPQGFSGKNVVGTYASGKPVKGRPRTALFGVAAAGAATAGIALLKQEPPGRVTTPSIEVIIVPAVPVSLSGPPFTLQLRVNVPVDLDSGQVRAQLYERAPDAGPACASMSGPVFFLRQFSPHYVSLAGLALSGACRPPFTAGQARVVIQDDGGMERYRTGQSLPDLPLGIQFVP